MIPVTSKLMSVRNTQGHAKWCITLQHPKCCIHHECLFIKPAKAFTSKFYTVLCNTHWERVCVFCWVSPSTNAMSVTLCLSHTKSSKCTVHFFLAQEMHMYNTCITSSSRVCCYYIHCWQVRVRRTIFFLCV